MVRVPPDRPGQTRDHAHTSAGYSLSFLGLCAIARSETAAPKMSGTARMFECTPIHGTRRAFKPVSVGSAKQAISIHPQPPSKRRLSPSPCLCIPLPAVKWAAGRHGRTDRAGLGVIPSGHGVNVTHTRRTEGIWTDRPPLGVRADQHGDGGELQSGSTAPGSVCSSHCSAEARDRQPPSPALPSPVLTCPPARPSL